MIEVGTTYLSPKYGRKIEVLFIEKEDSESYKLEIFWVEDNSPNELDYLTVSKEDTSRWVKVNL